jgi:hypothetical protein
MLKLMFRMLGLTWRSYRLVCALFAIFFLAFSSVASSAQDADDKPASYSMQRVKTLASPALSAALANQLEPLGYRVLSKSEDGDTKLICEIFWAKTVRMETANIDNDVVYGNLKQGSLIGVIHFLIVQRYVRDYRSQDLRPGYYTMRYAVMPKSGTWSGKQKEPRDFVLLTPVRADRNPAATLPVPELIHRSRLASPIHHPVAMSLIEVDPDEKLPSLITDDEGTSTLQVKLPRAMAEGKSKEFVPLALVVITAIPEDLGD